MAQYGKNFYGSTYYGNTNAFSGIYETKSIFTQQSLKGPFTVNIDAIMPDVNYKYNASEIMKVSGTWTANATFGYLQSSNPSAELKLMATCDRIIINYQKNSSAPTNVNVQVTTSQPGLADVITNYTFNPNSTTINPNAQYIISNIPYGLQQVRIFLDSTNSSSAYFQFKSIDARVTNFTIETSASADNISWTTYAKVTMTSSATAGVDDGYYLTGTSPDYTGKKYIRVKVHLASSDDKTTPTIEDLETISGNSNNRTDDGVWEAIFDMNAVATAASKTFQEVTEIDWVATTPDTTTLDIRSSSATTNDALAYGPVSVPYRHNVNRLRLKKNFTEGYMDVPMISPDSTHTTTLRWDNWDDQSYLPPDRVGCDVIYSAMDNTKNETNATHAIQTPMDIPLGSRTFLTSPLKDGRDFFFRVRLRRGRGKATPAVDWVKLTSWMQYKQEYHVTQYDASPVDGDNNGEKLLTKLSSYTYNPPPEVTVPDYHLIDKTDRPNDITIYYAFEKNSLSRTNVTNVIGNGDIWVRAETRDVGEDKGIIKHYQYGGGSAKYPVTDELEMAPIFTPSLDGTIKYRYFLESGWPTVYHTVVAGDTLDTIATDYNKSLSDIQAVNPKPAYDNSNNLIVGQSIQIPNDTMNTNVTLKWKTAGVVSTDHLLTDTSGHNALLQGSSNLQSDFIQATVSNNSMYGEVDWVSGEKIFDGIVNPNDIRSAFIRKHNTPKSGDSANVNYTTISGDTYASIAKKFNVYELDLRAQNNARDGQEPIVGQVVIVPAHITLPDIDPKAIVDDNPYEISIIYNSVHKEDGTKLSDDVMVSSPLQIEWHEVEIDSEPVVRGPIANGKDLLAKPRVTEILSAADASGFAWNPTVTVAGTTTQGSYKLNGNYIDWSNPNSATITEPAIGSTYYVSYKYMAPKTVTVTVDTTYKEEGGVDHIWRSPEVKEFSGMCFPGHDDKQELPPVTEWIGVNDDPFVEDIEYMVEDNDLWVKTWIQQEGNNSYVIGSLQDRVPKDNWFPTINTGYYYLSNDEFYLFSEPIVVEPTEREMPVTKNVQFSTGKYASAVYLQEGSTNLVRNSGFETSTAKNTVFKISFA